MDINPSMKISLGSKETMTLIEDLERRLRGQIDKTEHLKLRVAEALISNVSSTGLGLMERASVDLKMGLVEYVGFLCHLKERVKSLEMGATLLTQARTKPRTWGSSRRASRPYHSRPPPLEDTQSELGWRPVWQRGNSDTASEISCAW